MIRHRNARFSGLLGESAGAEITADAVFEHHAPRGQRSGQRQIVHHRDAVADAFGAEYLYRFAHRFGTAELPRMADDSQSLAARQIECRAEVYGGKGKFVTAHAKTNHA